MKTLHKYIEEFNKTGILVDDEETVLSILSVYESLLDNLCKVPDMQCVITHVVLQRNMFDNIARARGYK